MGADLAYPHAMQDLRYGIRMLARTPAFTAIAIATLALGIGLNTTIFTVFNAVALKPLPVRDGGTLMRIERWFVSGRLGAAQYAFSWQEYQYLKERSHSFPDLIAVGGRIGASGVLPAPSGSSPASPVRLTGEMVSANYFTALLTAPAFGRTFTADETRLPGAAPVVVLSYPFWQHQLGADPNVVGRTLMLNGVAFTIVGVTPRDFIGTANPPAIPDF